MPLPLDHSGGQNGFEESRFLQGKVNSARHVAQVVHPALLPFIQQEGDVLFSRTAHVHIRLLRRNVLFVVYNNWPFSNYPRSLVYWTRMGHDEAGTCIFFQTLPEPMPTCDNGFKLLGTTYRRMTFGIFMTVCMRDYTPVLQPEGLHQGRGQDTALWRHLTQLCLLAGDVSAGTVKCGQQLVRGERGY